MYTPSQLMPATSGLGKVLKPGHPFVHYFDAYENQLIGEAYFHEDVRTNKNCVALAENRGGYLIACQIGSYDGTLVFVPPQRDGESEAECKLGGVLFQCIQAVLGTPAQLEEPPWAEEFEIQGLDSVESEVTAAQRHLAEAETELVGAERARDELKRLRSILWTSRKE